MSRGFWIIFKTFLRDEDYRRRIFLFPLSIFYNYIIHLLRGYVNNFLAYESVFIKFFQVTAAAFTCCFCSCSPGWEVFPTTSQKSTPLPTALIEHKGYKMTEEKMTPTRRKKCKNFAQTRRILISERTEENL